ncbi:MAG TPA: DUF4251 domain-containing protein [Mucilaginibacter sp.]|jgi:hypothetical protein|nr:DUF4251 domain-containing protein [Mucilaginibacter sp.]
MKTLRNLFILVLIVSAGLKAALAQNTRKDKKAEKEATIKKNVDGRHYTFSATYMLPLRGGAKAITDVYYDLRVTKDSLIVYLPYYGQAYFDVPYNGDSGMKFTSTKFSYDVKEKKKGGWEIVMKPSDVKNIEQLRLYISSDGYASLSINSVNRDFIDYNGYLK